MQPAEAKARSIVADPPRPSALLPVVWRLLDDGRAYIAE
jgi:hypothetical protein